MKTLGLFLVLASIPAMPQAALAPVGVQQFFDNTGVPLSGGTVTTYIAGTTTKLATYTDATGTIPASNPIVLDAGGFASIWLGSGSYKFVVKRADGVTVSTTDNITSVGAGLVGLANTWTMPQTIYDLITKNTPVMDVRAYGAKCVGDLTDDSTAIQAAVNAAAANSTILIPGVCAIGSTITLPATTLVNLVGVSPSQSQLKALAGFTGDMVFKADGVVLNRGTIANLTFNCNSNATTGLEIYSYRQLTLRELYALDCKGSQYIIGHDGLTHLVGLNAYNVNGDEGGYVQSAGVAARPNYGIELRSNVDDSFFDTGVFNHIAIAGMYNGGQNNHISHFHPWGYGPSGTIPNSWPDYGIVAAGLDTMVSGAEFDTIRVAGVKQSANRLNITDSQYVSGPDASGYLVEADAGTDSLTLAHNRVVATWNAAPVHWLGTGPGVYTWVYDNGFGAQTYFPTEFELQSLSIKNKADANLYVVCQSGSTVDEDCMTEYRSHTGTAIYRVGRKSSGAFYILDTFNNIAILQGGIGAETYLDSEGTGSIFFNDWVNSSTGGVQFGSGGASPTISAVITGTGKATFNGGIDNSAQAGSFLKIKDQGSCTMAAGTCSAQSLGHTYAAAPVCFANWNGTGTLTGLIKVPSTTTTVTPASSVGTDTAVTNWFCVGS